MKSPLHPEESESRGGLAAPRDAAWLLRFARRFAPDASTAEDVAQDTWLAAVEHVPDGLSPRRRRAWLARVARNFAHRAREDRQVRSHHERRAARDDGATDEDEWEEGAAAVLATLQVLSSAHRTVLLERFWEGLSHVEIARRHGIPQTAARKRVSRALAALRERLEERRSRSGGHAGVRPMVDVIRRWGRSWAPPSVAAGVAAILAIAWSAPSVEPRDGMRALLGTWVSPRREVGSEILEYRRDARTGAVSVDVRIEGGGEPDVQVAEGVYRVGASAGELEFRGMARVPGAVEHARGSASIGSDGVLTMSLVVRAADGSTRRLRERIDVTNGDVLRVEVERVDGAGEWAPWGRAEFVRVGDAAPLRRR